jgi:hypothetical protein
VKHVLPYNIDVECLLPQLPMDVDKVVIDVIGNQKVDDESV